MRWFEGDKVAQERWSLFADDIYNEYSTLGVIIINYGKMFKFTAGKWEKALSKDIR